MLVAAAVGLAALLLSSSSIRGNPPRNIITRRLQVRGSVTTVTFISTSHPSYEPHPRYLGELSGSWEDIGKQYGEKAGDLTRMVYEGWYRELLPIQGSPDAIIAYVHQEETCYKALVPEALDLMKGMADGAKDDLDESTYAGVMTNYEKIILINSYFGLQAKPPVASTPAPTHSDQVHSCSGAGDFG